MGMIDFDELDRLIAETSMHDADDDRALPYAALGLGGESGEVLELVKKSLRPHAGPLCKIRTIMELSDVQWYLGRIVQILGARSEDVVVALQTKMDLRRANGKDPANEYKVIKDILERRGVKP